MDEININFIIFDGRSIDPKQIVLVDTSTWGAIESQPATISITAPGYKKEQTFQFPKGEVMLITAQTLNLQPQGQEKLSDLPDGIYKFVVTGTPSTYSKTKDYLKTDLFRYKYDRMLVSKIGNCSDMSSSDKDLFVTVKFLLDSAEAYVNLGDWCKAGSAFQEAEKLLKNIDCN